MRCFLYIFIFWSDNNRSICLDTLRSGDIEHPPQVGEVPPLWPRISCGKYCALLQKREVHIIYSALPHVWIMRQVDSKVTLLDPLTWLSSVFLAVYHYLHKCCSHCMHTISYIYIYDPQIVSQMSSQDNLWERVGLIKYMVCDLQFSGIVLFMQKPVVKGFCMLQNQCHSGGAYLLLQYVLHFKTVSKPQNVI